MFHFFQLLSSSYLALEHWCWMRTFCSPTWFGRFHSEGRPIACIPVSIMQASVCSPLRLFLWLRWHHYSCLNALSGSWHWCGGHTGVTLCQGKVLQESMTRQRAGTRKGGPPSCSAGQLGYSINLSSFPGGWYLHKWIMLRLFNIIYVACNLLLF